MIVISGALVLVALVLLVIGLVSTSLPFVYASIAVSVVSFVFLIIGILQRRGEQLPDAVSAGDAVAPEGAADAEPVTAVVRSSRRSTEPEASGTDDIPVSGAVLVVAGRPRYHVVGCRYLNGKDPDEVPVNDARDEGFTACGVCKPDQVLAEAAAAQPQPQPDEPAVVSADDATEVTGAEEVAVPAPSSRTRATKAPAKTPAKAPAKRAAAATAAPAKKAASKAAPAKAPSKAAVAAAASTPAAASAAKKPGSVVVIPDRGKFHTPVCRYVRDVADAQALSRAQATRQGYDACGVCKP